MRPRVSLLLLAALIAVSVPSAYAQQARKPFRTEFGPGERDEQRADQLVLTGGTYTGADDTSRLAGAVLQDESLQSGRMHQGGTMALKFVRRRPRLSVTASGQSAVRYYHSLNRVGTQRHSVSASGEWVASRQLSFQFGQDATYSPSYHLALAGAPDIGAEAPADTGSLDFELSRSKQFMLGSFASAKYIMSPSREITAGYSLSYTNYLIAQQRDFGIQQASIRFSQRLTSGVALKLGYGVGSGTGTGLGESTRQLIDAGVAFDRSIAISPRTIVGFNSGSAIVNTDGGRQVELIGNLNVRRRLSPRWTASIAYQRGLMAIDGVANPLTTNTMTADLSGFLGMQTSVVIRPAYSWGADVNDATQSFHNNTSMARVQTALGRHWAAYAEYIYYDHRFSDIVGLRPSLAVDTRRHGVRTGVTLWSPLR